MATTLLQNALLDWYRQNRRDFPWRLNRDPYRIWISETMLQQTTTTAVIPYFERFVARFPTLSTLAGASEADVVEQWAGLGYYSRARNLHKAAQALQTAGGFPTTAEALIQFSGFGPYTSRAVASLAFSQAVGVVDGNVIRVLSRFEGEDWEWWKPKVRDLIQTRADAWVGNVPSNEMNQALMELGRTLCTPKSPSCPLCPLRTKCASLKTAEVTSRPKPKPRREREIWLWEPHLTVRSARLLLRKNSEFPFLRDQWLPPGQARRVAVKPKSFDYHHSITHHDIYVTVMSPLSKMNKNDKWIPLKEIRRYVPASLVRKALDRLGHSDDRSRLHARPNRTAADPGRGK